MRNISISYINTAGASDDEYNRFLPRLYEEEQERALRFVFAKDRLAFTLGRVLVRHMLPPDLDPRFVLNPYGRPELQTAAGSPGLRFNISHCAGIVAAAFARDCDVGLDVERSDRDCGDLAIARSYFAPEEAQALESLPVEERRAAFITFWTLKESYIKARGMGLSIPLSDFCFSLDPLRIAFSPEIDDDPGRWFFWRGSPVPGCQMALAATRIPGEDFDITCREVSIESLL